MRSTLNADVPLAAEGEFPPLRIGPLVVDPPIVLAPMAGVTNAAFRTLCRRFSGGRILYVSEMITARSFALRNEKTLRLAAFGADETTRSIQLYGTDDQSLAEATRILVGEWGVHHVDVNLGCPVRKITAQGGGSAIPVRPRLMARLVGAVVRAAGDVPVTCKFRKGIDDDVLTYRDAGRVAVDVGCRAIALHARTAAQLYDGEADWDAIGELKALVPEIPVLGNGDVYEAFDALRMMRATGCDGVVVGRGCLGRPWLFRELCETFAGREPSPPPDLGGVADVALEHARLLVERFGERAAIQQMRKHVGWYTKSFAGAKRRLPALQQIVTLADLERELGRLPRDLPFPAAALRVRRGKGAGAQAKVSLPHGFLDDRDADYALAGHAEPDGGEAWSGG
jgi:nifR3 family TIM-barrel protein